MTDVVLFRCHELGEQSLQLYQKLRKELPNYDVVACGYVSAPVVVSPNVEVGAAFYNRARLETLPYGKKLATVNWSNPVGHNDLPVMQFFRTHSGYANYWIIEYDVHYSGNWSGIFAELSQSSAGLLATNILDHDSLPNWGWWKSIQPPEAPIGPGQQVKAFLPFARASARLLAELDRCYQEGWTGHYEALWPIIATLAGIGIEDIGADNPYTPAKWRHRHYSSNAQHWALYPGTFQYRPCYDFDEMMDISRKLTRQPMLWHPVKGRK
jgi:hypothetical protein